MGRFVVFFKIIIIIIIILVCPNSGMLQIVVNFVSFDVGSQIFWVVALGRILCIDVVLVVKKQETWISQQWGTRRIDAIGMDVKKLFLQ